MNSRDEEAAQIMPKENDNCQQGTKMDRGIKSKALVWPGQQM